MQMRKIIFSLLMIATILLCGCQNSSDNFLNYQNTVNIAGTALDNQLTQGAFFAEDIAIVTEKDNKGDDSQLTCGTSLLINDSDNQVIYADKVYDKLYPASLTKLLTALVVLRSGELTDTVTIGYNATHIAEGGVKLCGFHEGDSISLEALLNSMLIYSGNDAAIALAEHVGGSVEEFVKRMNEEAAKVGATHSHFVNPNGLHDDNQYTTAYDLYLIFHELMQYDTFVGIISTSSYTAKYSDKDGNAKEKKFTSTNLYLKEDAQPNPQLIVVGGKTGTTRKAGNCLILLSKSKQEKEYISVILKSDSSEKLYSQMSYLLSLASK